MFPGRTSYLIQPICPTRDREKYATFFFLLSDLLLSYYNKIIVLFIILLLTGIAILSEKAAAELGQHICQQGSLHIYSHDRFFIQRLIQAHPYNCSS